MRKLVWALIIIIAVGGGALLARRRPTPIGPQVAASNSLAQTSSSQDEPKSSEPPPAGDANTPANSPPVTPPTPVALPAFQTINYQAKAGEQAALASLKTFYDAYNQADTAKIAAQFDLSVAVTAAIAVATQPGIPRPIAVAIKEINTSTDGFQTVVVDETRSDQKVYGRVIELEPARSGMLLTAYRSSVTAAEASGF